MPRIIRALRAVESLLYRGIELVDSQDRDDDGLVTDALASEDSCAQWPPAAA
jgi:hypothetical protein